MTEMARMLAFCNMRGYGLNISMANDADYFGGWGFGEQKEPYDVELKPKQM